MKRCGKSLMLFLGLCLAVPSIGVTMPKKPKPTPTPGPDPDPEIVYVQKQKKGRAWTTKIKVMNADGSNQSEVVNCGTASCWAPDWSPDGSQIIFVSDAFDTFAPPYTGGIYLVDVDGDNLTKIIDLQGGPGQPAWSPVPIGGEHWIVYSDEDPGHSSGGYHDLYAYGVDSETTVNLFDPLYWDPTYYHFEDITVAQPAWSADGAFLAARLMWDLHPWHVHTNFFEVGFSADVPALGKQYAIKYDQYDLHCGFGEPDWANMAGDYTMLAMCGLEITYRLDFLQPFPAATWAEEWGVYMADLAGPPTDLRQQIPPTGGADGVYGIWVQDGRFSPDNSQFVFQAVFRDPNLKATGIYVASTDNSGPVVELIKIGINQGSVESPEWRGPVPD